jgi:hypothetical protein
MNITYTYEIISVDQEARCMEIVYSSEGRQTMHIGARLPLNGESLDSVIQMYAPLAYWIERDTVATAPEIGSTGSVTVDIPEPTPLSYRETRAMAYRTESDPIFFKWQRGEATEQEWKAAVASVRATHPAPIPTTEFA